MTEYIFPQLEYHYRNKYEIAEFNQVIIRPSLIDKELIKSDNIDSIVYGNNIFNLLMNDDYSFSDYTHLFTDMPYSEMHEELSYCVNGTYFKVLNSTTTTGTDMFGLESIDFTMLDLMIQYRNNGIVTLPSSDLTYYTTKLSKLIFIFLYGRLNSDKPVDYTEVISEESDNLLVVLYEDYVIRDLYKTLRGY